MLLAILNNCWGQHPIKQQLFSHIPPITKTIKIGRIRHAGHCGRSRHELISDVLLWTPSHERAKAGQPDRTYVQQLCADSGYRPENLQEAMDDWEWWPVMVRGIRADGATWWGWWFVRIFVCVRVCVCNRCIIRNLSSRSYLITVENNPVWNM